MTAFNKPSGRLAGLDEDNSDRRLTDRDAARSYIVTSLLVAALLGGSLFSFNCIVNASGMFGWQVLEPIVWVARGEKVQLLQEQEQPIEALVLGSSRAMKIEPSKVEQITGLRTFNAAVNSARSEDYLAMLRWAVEDAYVVPKQVVLGLDVEAFHNAVPVDLRALSVPQLAAKLPLRLAMQARVERLKRALGLPELRLALRSVANVDNRAAPDAVFDQSGLLTYRGWDAQLASGTLDLAANVESSIRGYRSRFAGFSALDEERVLLFEELLVFCDRQGIKLSAYITPVHPDIARDLALHSTYEERLMELRSLLAELGSRHRFDLLDASNIEAIGGSAEHFYDGGHPQVQNNRLILEQLLGVGGGDAVQ